MSHFSVLYKLNPNFKNRFPKILSAGSVLLEGKKFKPLACPNPAKRVLCLIVNLPIIFGTIYQILTSDFKNYGTTVYNIL